MVYGCGCCLYGVWFQSRWLVTTMDLYAQSRTIKNQPRAQQHKSSREQTKRGSKGRGGRTRVVRSYLYSNIYSLVQELHARRRVRNNNSKHSSFVRSWGISRYSRLFLELIKITWRNSGGSDSWTCPAAKPTRTASRKRGWKNNNNNEVH